MTDVKRLLVYLFYDPDGYVDLSVLRTLGAFRSVSTKTLVVSNGPLSDTAVESLETVADAVLVRENTGFDVGAYKAGLEEIGGVDLASFDELILANSTFFSVEDGFTDLFEKMASSESDFWGITDHPEVSPHPFTGSGVMRAHLQTYWVVVRNKMLKDPRFFQYWQSLPTPSTYERVVTEFETEFSHHFAELGYRWEAVFPAADFGVDNPTMQAPLALLRAGCPIVKKRLYFHGTEHLLDLGVSVAQVTKEVLSRGLTREIIFDAVLRRTEADQAAVALGALYVIPEPNFEPALESQSVPGQGLSSTRLDRRAWPALAKNKWNPDEMADLLVTIPDPSEPPRQDGELWRRSTSLAAIAGNPTYLADVFKREPRLGMVAPTLQFVGTSETDREWLPQARNTWLIAQAMGLHRRPSRHGPVAAYRGIAVYRAEALLGFGERIRAAGGWDALAALAGSEDALQVALDQLVADHMLVRGYYPGQATTEEQLSTEAPLWMVEAQAHFARFRGYSEYMHDWKVLPTHPQDGQVFWMKSDKPFVYPVLSRTYGRLPLIHRGLNYLYNRSLFRRAKKGRP